MKTVQSLRRRLTVTSLIVVASALLGNCALDRWLEPRTFDCPKPPAGVIRFSLTSGRSDGKLYEWTGKAFREVGTTPVGKQMVERFPQNTRVTPYFWGDDVQAVPRAQGKDEQILQTPSVLSG